MPRSHLRHLVALPILLVLAILVATPRARAIEIGAAVGFGSSSLIGDAPSGLSFGSGGAGALVATLDVELNSAVALSVQPGYSRTGAALQAKSEEIVPDVDIEIDYVEVPVMVRVYANEKHRRPYVLGGFAAGFPVRAKVGDTDIMDDLESADVRAIFAGGMRLPAWSHAMFVELRYMQSITNITKNRSRPESSSGSLRYKASSFGLWVGYAFDL